jgi:hypothetical protein
MDIFLHEGKQFVTASGIAAALGLTPQAASRFLRNARNRYGLPAYRHPHNRREVLYPLAHPEVQKFLHGTGDRMPDGRERRRR